MKSAIWIERRFPEGLPVDLIPALLERLWGCVPRLRTMLTGLAVEDLTRAAKGEWSIQREVGHLLDLEALWRTRVHELLDAAQILSAADMSNQATEDADHDERPLNLILDALALSRAALAGSLQEASEAQLSLRSKHPRLGHAMGIPDLLFFVAEHDDHHLARIRRKLSAFSG